jgi:hypothetical protein
MVSATATLATMSKPQSDRHKPGSKMARIKARLVQQAELLGERLEHDFTQIVNDAVREKLERAGLWPPPDEERPAPRRRPKP